MVKNSKRKSRRIFKICILGDGYVGKTSLRRRFLGESLNQDYIFTIGADFARYATEIEEKPIIVQIWDLSGQTGFEFLHTFYLKGISGAMFVFDLTNEVSFLNLPFWLSCIEKANVAINIPTILVGNKVDIQDNLEIETMDAIDYARDIELTTERDVIYCETSALTGLRVQEAFEGLISLTIVDEEKKKIDH